MYVCVCVCVRVARKGKKKSVGVHLQFVAATRQPARLPADTCPPPTTAARTFSMHVCLYVCVWILRLHALLSQLLWLQLLLVFRFFAHHFSIGTLPQHCARLCALAVRRPPCTFRLLCCMNFGYLTPQRKSINIIFHACLAVLYGACGHSCCCQSRPAPLHALLLSSLRPAPAIFIALSLCSYRFFVCQYFSLRLFLTKYIAVIAFIAFWLVHCGYCNFFSLLFLPLSFLWLARFQLLT